MLESKPFSVLLVDDHQMMRLGLKLISQTNSKMPLLFIEAGNFGDAITAYAANPEVDLVLLDMNLPDSKGLQTLQRFLNHFPKARIAIFSATEDEFVIKQAMALGAIGFIPKSAQATNSLRVLEVLLGGREAMAKSHPVTISQPSPALSTDVLRERVDKLSAKQLKVLELMLAGMSNQAIATECNFALGTVKNIVSAIFLELDVTSRAHLLSLFR
jgi:DNA-binding NarL/FixJ family response regulator